MSQAVSTRECQGRRQSGWIRVCDDGWTTQMCGTRVQETSFLGTVIKKKEYTGTFWKSDCFIVWVVVIRLYGVKTKESS